MRKNGPCGISRAGFEKGQATMEFLLLQLAGLAIVSILASALLFQAAQARALSEAHRSVMAAGPIAQAAQAAGFCGMNMSGRLSGEFAVEGGYLHLRQGSGVIEIRGVFTNDQSEPV